MLSAASQLLLLMKWRSLRSFLGADFPASAKSAPRKLRVNCSTIFGSAWKSYRLRYSLSSRLCYIMSTKEKQATLKAAFVFLVPLENEQPAEAGDRARQRGLVIEEEKRERGQPSCSSQRAKPVADNRFILTCWFDLVISFIILMFLVQFYTRFQACTQFFTRRWLNSWIRLIKVYKL